MLVSYAKITARGVFGVDLNRQSISRCHYNRQSELSSVGSLILLPYENTLLPASVKSSIDYSHAFDTLVGHISDIHLLPAKISAFLNFINNNKQWITLFCILTTNVSLSEILL